MSDMLAAITPKSDQLNADDLIGGPRTIRIREVQVKGGPEQPVWIYFDGDNNKPWKPCKSMTRCLVYVWGNESVHYIGKSLTLYLDPSVKWGGLAVGGIRISHMSHMDGKQTMMLTATKGKKTPHTVLPLEIQQKATPTPSTAPTAAEIDDGRAKLTNAAGHGTEALQAAWKILTKPGLRTALESELPALKQKAATNDQPQGLHGNQGEA